MDTKKPRGEKVSSGAFFRSAAVSALPAGLQIGDQLPAGRLIGPHLLDPLPGGKTVLILHPGQPVQDERRSAWGYQATDWTSVISGMCSLRIRSMPIFKVICDMGQP